MPSVSHTSHISILTQEIIISTIFRDRDTNRIGGHRNPIRGFDLMHGAMLTAPHFGCLELLYCLILRDKTLLITFVEMCRFLITLPCKSRYSK